MTTRRARRARVAAFGLVLVASIGGSLWSVEQGRENSVHGCNRTRLDRIDNANAWEAAYWSRTMAASHETGLRRRVDLRAAREFRVAVGGLRARIVNCEEAFPPVWKAG